MNLAQLQQHMCEWLAGDELAACRFESSARAGLDVYQNNYRAQLVACLSDTFARVKTWLGDEAFLASAVRHIDTAPPSDWTLDNYGRNFPRTLRVLYPSEPEVSELAWLDRALADAFVGPDVAPMNMSALASVDWEEAIFRLAPTLQIGSASTNSTAIWSALSADSPPPAVECLPQPATLLVWRKGWTSCFRTIDAREAAMIDLIRTGATFGNLCSTLTEEYDAQEGVNIAGTALARWLQDELVVGLAPRTYGLVVRRART